jgi:hypothetical protein
MSQADSAYTTSRSILPAGLALRRRQFVTGGVAALAAAVTGSRAASVPVPEAPDQILAAIEGHRRDFEELRRLFAEQDAAERELRRAHKGRRATLEAQLADLCEAEGPLGCAEMKASLRLAKTVPASRSGCGAALCARALRRRPISYVRRGWLPPAAVLDRTCDLRCCRSRRTATWSVISNDSACSETPRSRGGRERAARPRLPAPVAKHGFDKFCAADPAPPAAFSRGPRSRA